MSTESRFAKPIDKLCVDLERRLRAGERRVSEKLLSQNPQFGENDDAAIELIYREFLVLQELSEPAKPEEFLARFAKWRDRLRRLERGHLVSRQER